MSEYVKWLTASFLAIGVNDMLRSRHMIPLSPDEMWFDGIATTLLGVAVLALWMVLERRERK